MSFYSFFKTGTEPNHYRFIEISKMEINFKINLKELKQNLIENVKTLKHSEKLK